MAFVIPLEHYDMLEFSMYLYISDILKSQGISVKILNLSKYSFRGVYLQPVQTSLLKFRF